MILIRIVKSTLALFQQAELILGERASCGGRGEGDAAGLLSAPGQCCGNTSAVESGHEGAESCSLQMNAGL